MASERSRPNIADKLAIAQLVEHLTVGLQTSDGPWFDSGWPDFCATLQMSRVASDVIAAHACETHDARARIPLVWPSIHGQSVWSKGNTMEPTGCCACTASTNGRWPAYKSTPLMERREVKGLWGPAGLSVFIFPWCYR